MVDVKREVSMYREELVQLRRDFHMNPELGFEEYRTAEKVADYLEACGLEVTRNVAKTGVVGLLKGTKPGPTIMLRSDMDALPLNEETVLPFKSKKNGVMHACGHDGHLAMLLIAAKVLSAKKDQLSGNIKFVFQPNEEDAGAEIMIGEGILENPKVDAALGIHLWSPIETGKIGIVSGPIMASSYYFKLVITGKGGHGGAPHRAIDPISCATHVMHTVQTMQTKEMDALDPTVITFCKINAGTSPIIVPEKIEVEGSLRCLHDKTEAVQARFEELIKSICTLHKTQYTLDFKCGNSLLSNDEKMVNLVKSAAEKVIGADKIQVENVRVMLGEDYAEFTKRVPGAFYFVGIANKEKGTDYPHHHPKFDIDEDALLIGAQMHVQSAIDYLGE